MADSKREKLLKEMAAIFSTTSGSGGTSFDRVLDSPYSGRRLQGKTVLSIVEGIEIYLDVVSPDKRDRALEVDLTCHTYAPTNTTLRAAANTVLADLEEIAEANSKWGGFAYATFFTSNSIDREDTGDRTIEVTLFLSVRYRTKRSDPRS